MFISKLCFADYCQDKYNSQISAANAELGTLAKENAALDEQITKGMEDSIQVMKDMANASKANPIDVKLIGDLGAKGESLNNKIDENKKKGFANLDRMKVLKATIPAKLQGELRGCVEATAPANTLVNFSIQGLALLSTGGLSATLPPQALYVDMAAVLNGYPTGGDSSVINQSREAALKALPFGLGSEDNDLGKTFRDPGRIVRCIFGC